MSDLRVLASVINSTDGVSVDTAAFDADPVLLIFVRISGYSDVSTARLRFNGDASTANYSFKVSEDFGAANTGSAGNCSGIDVAVTTDEGRALLVFWVSNEPGTEHGVFFGGSTGTLSPTVAPKIVLGSGIWGVAEQITSVQIEAGAGGGTLDPGCVVVVCGVRI